MDKHKKHRHHDQHAEGGREEHERDTAPAPDRAGDAADASEVDVALASPDLAQLKRERDEYLSHWQRAQADYQNLRRRLQSDTDAAVQRGKAALLQDLFLVMDYLDMALATPCTTSECKSLLAGIELTKSVLTRALQREGIEPVAEGGAFDAAVHQAVERTESPGAEPGRVLQTLRRGYKQNGQVVRPAQVRVSVDSASERATDGDDEAANDSGEAG